MTNTSSNTHVKICGLTRAEDVNAAIEAGASYLGFIVEAPSKRKVSVTQAAKISAPASGIISRVAVTVNPDDALLTRIMAEMAPDYIQCHGDESAARVAEIARTYNVKTIKACGIASDEDMKTAEYYSGVCDFILYDAKPPQNDPIRGGHGTLINWGLIRNAPTPKVFALAGGLNPQNVGRIARDVNAPIVDVSSGVESKAGIKDANKIHAFMEAVRHG
jgi:phosphoribosylanthranilate isomerase